MTPNFAGTQWRRGKSFRLRVIRGFVPLRRGTSTRQYVAGNACRLDVTPKGCDRQPRVVVRYSCGRHRCLRVKRELRVEHEFFFFRYKFVDGRMLTTVPAVLFIFLPL